MPAASLPSALLPQVTCPYCWHQFDPSDVLWVAAHPSLRGDPRLGPDAQVRFLPSRFAPAGAAVDEAGGVCTELACPGCHLTVPRVLLELEPWFASIVGAPGCGKSYYLAAMTWALRRRLPEWFRVGFTDTDAGLNQAVAGYGQRLFANFRPDRPEPLARLIEKTKEQDEQLYDTVLVDGQAVQRPRPFLFTARPTGPPAPGAAVTPGRVVCLYDNAGESFLAGRETAARPVTRHLARSSLLLFLFDPTQHAPFRRRLEGAGVPLASDLRPGADALPRQDLILTEMAARTRRHAGLADTALHDKPLVVIVTKQDVWGPLLPPDSDTPVITDKGGQHVLNVGRVEAVSAAIKGLMAEHAREVVAAAEGFARSVTYVGVSALGVVPHRDPDTDQWAVRPGQVRPDGVELPVLYGLFKTGTGLVKGGRKMPGPKAGGSRG